jgi:hypothetical protein
MFYPVRLALRANIESKGDGLDVVDWFHFSSIAVKALLQCLYTGDNSESVMTEEVRRLIPSCLNIIVNGLTQLEYCTPTTIIKFHHNVFVIAGHLGLEDVEQRPHKKLRKFANAINGCLQCSTSTRGLIQG